MEARLGPHEETVGASVGGYAHRACGVSIHCVGLVVAWHGEARGAHQRGKGEFHALGGVAAQHIGIQRIEGEEGLVELASGPDVGEDAALGRAGVHVGEVLEIRRIFEVAEGGNAVGFGLLCASATRDEGGGDCAGADREHLAA